MQRYGLTCAGRSLKLADLLTLFRVTTAPPALSATLWRRAHRAGRTWLEYTLAMESLDSALSAERSPRLIIFGGLPGTGKTTIAKSLARRLAATYLRIDSIEQSILRAGPGAHAVNEEGYRVAYAVAEDNLRLGQTVIADSVNPLPQSRDAWLEVAQQAEVPAAEVEVTCSNGLIHRQRIETRVSDIEGLRLPTWEHVLARHYAPWTRDHIILDTAGQSIAQTLAQLEQALAHPERLAPLRKQLRP